MSDSDDTIQTVNQARSLITCALAEDANEEGLMTILDDIRDCGDFEAVTLFLVGMLTEFIEYFTEDPRAEWTHMMLMNAQLEEQGDSNA